MMTGRLIGYDLGVASVALAITLAWGATELAVGLVATVIVLAFEGG